jgi:hypothetical protein
MLYELLVLSQVATLRQINSNNNYVNYLKSEAKRFHKSSMGIQLEFLWIGKQFHFVLLC